MFYPSQEKSTEVSLEAAPDILTNVQHLLVCLISKDILMRLKQICIVKPEREIAFVLIARDRVRGQQQSGQYVRLIWGH